MSDLTFKEKLESDTFDIKYLTNLKATLQRDLETGVIHSNNKESVKSKLSLIDKYLRKQYSEVAVTPSKPVVTSSRKITLNPTSKVINGGSIVVSDEQVARKFLQVKDGAKERGLEFSLNLTSVKNLLKAKRCYYSGLPFDHTDPERSLTFDRVDYKVGYVKGNVVACMKSVNDLKNILIEHPVSTFKDNPKLLLKVVNKWNSCK